jgi:hypothetical protein
MADEPNKRMDDMLKAYADRRRQDAGGPIELHPATRQMLQAEVARTYKEVPAASWLQRTIAFWPRVAFATACLVITLTLVLIVLPRRTVTHVAQMSAEPESLSLDSRLADKEKADSFALADSPVPTESTTPMRPRSLEQLAKKNEADELKAKSEVAERRKDLDGAKLMREESAAAKPLARQSYANVAGTAGSSYRYTQQTRDTQLGARLQTVQPILNNFELEQIGDRIRITEPDGSVYNGNLLSADEAQKRYYKLPGNAPALQSVTGPAVAEQLFFAVGTNVSLKQQVSIEANFVQVTNVLSAPAPSNQQLNENRRAGAPGQVQAIRGRARVGTNQEVLIEAVPAQP